MGFYQYSMPKYDEKSNKWCFEICDENEVLVERVERDTEQEALAEHRKRFMDDVLNDRTMKGVRR